MMIDNWEKVLNVAKCTITDAKEFATWIRPIVPISIKGQYMHVEVPSTFFLQYIQSKGYTRVLDYACKNVLGREVMYGIKKQEQATSVDVSKRTKIAKAEFKVGDIDGAYLLTSDKFEGQMEFVYNDKGLLIRFDIVGAKMSDVQYNYLSDNFPLSEEAMIAFARSTMLKVDRVKQTIDFDSFWKKWFAGRSVDNSSKKRTETKWNKMSKKERELAFGYIGTYFSKLAYGVSAKYAETYLNAELWNN